MKQKKQSQPLDEALLSRGLVSSHQEAVGLIMARRINVNGQIVDKRGSRIGGDDNLSVVPLEHPWVGRGGTKLAGALQQFSIHVGGKTCVDIGASTGGFTHVLLVHGAKRVYSVDVGYGQLDAQLRADPRVVVMDRTNARYLDASAFPDRIDFAAVDVSFIPVRLVIPAVRRVIADGADVVILIKPQFELDRSQIPKGGIVRDPDLRERAIHLVLDSVRESGLNVIQTIESPVRGAEGNVEYLLHARC